MAIGKNKMSKTKKGRSKVVDAFLKKEWYRLKAPATFTTREFGMTLCNKSQGIKLAVDSLKHRIFEVNLADLMTGDDEQSFRVKLCCEEVQGKNCLTDFHGLEMTRDRLCRLIRKWHSLIEAHVDVKTSDGFHLRLFCIAFTERNQEHVRWTCYAQKSKIKLIRKKMVETMAAEASSVTLHGLVKKLIGQNIGKEIETKCRAIYPLKDVFIRKVKVLKKQKFDYTRFAELYKEEVGADWGNTADDEKPQNLLTQEIQDM